MLSLRTRFLSVVISSVLLSIFSLSAHSYSSVGCWPGSLNITQFGAVADAIPIEILTDIKGMQSELALSYNNQAGNNESGIDWYLLNVSEIIWLGYVVGAKT